MIVYDFTEGKVSWPVLKMPGKLQNLIYKTTIWRIGDSICRFNVSNCRFPHPIRKNSRSICRLPLPICKPLPKKKTRLLLKEPGFLQTYLFIFLPIPFPRLCRAIRGFMILRRLLAFFQLIQFVCFGRFISCQVLSFESKDI